MSRYKDRQAQSQNLVRVNTAEKCISIVKIRSELKTTYQQDEGEAKQKKVKSHRLNDDEEIEIPEEWLVRQDINTECKKETCWSSDKKSPVCGSDGRTYLNPGVFECVLACKPKLKLEAFEDCEAVQAKKEEDEQSKVTERRFYRQVHTSIHFPCDVEIAPSATVKQHHFTKKIFAPTLTIPVTRHPRILVWEFVCSITFDRLTVSEHIIFFSALKGFLRTYLVA
ncbi:unnamed protein product [Allacma fusca]|uniref:Kazal-like domain-containing protein n=1 Tax=Allacma fusca TaxID=39272 RepID=A0A8J2LCI1_9HEXA|nr:unnamed protein product [Allacma fusca]